MGRRRGFGSFFFSCDFGRDLLGFFVEVKKDIVKTSGLSGFVRKWAARLGNYRELLSLFLSFHY